MLRHWLLRLSVRRATALIAVIACIAAASLTGAIITVLGRDTLWLAMGIAVPVSLIIAVPLGHTAVALIHELDALRQQLRTQATTDSLTGCMNRRHFLEKARALFERACEAEVPPFSLLMIDVDHFKAINDTHGHGEGDRALQGVVEAIRDELRSHDRLGRLGGEEFAVLLPETSRDDAKRVAERLRLHVDEATHVTISIGVAEFNPELEALRVLIKHADRAMYAAKEGGRNRVSVA